MLEALEYTLEIGKQSPKGIIFDRYQFLRRMASWHKKVNLLINFQDIELLKDYIDEIKSLEIHPKVRINLHLNGKYLLKDEVKQLLSVLTFFILVEDREDWETILKFDGRIDSIIFYFNENTMKDIFEGYFALYEAGISIIDVCNIKIRPPFDWDKNIGYITDQLLRILSKNEYWLNPENNEVYNMSTNLPLKGLRSISKFLLKYSYTLEHYNVTETSDGILAPRVNIRDFAKDDPRMSPIKIQDLVLNTFRKSNLPEEKFPKVGFYGKECDNCPNKEQCMNNADKENLFPRSDQQCLENKYAAYTEKLIKEHTNPNFKVRFKNGEIVEKMA